MKTTYLFRDALAEKRHLDALLRVQLGKAHVEHLEKQGVVALVHAELSVARGDEDVVEGLGLGPLDCCPRVVRACIDRVEPQMCRLNTQLFPNLLRQLVVAHPGVEDHLECRVLLDVAFLRMSVEHNRPLIEQEMVVFTRVLRSVERFSIKVSVAVHSQWHRAL